MIVCIYPCSLWKVITAIQKQQSEKVADLEQRVEQLEDDVLELQSLRTEDAERVESLKNLQKYDWII